MSGERCHLGLFAGAKRCSAKVCESECWYKTHAFGVAAVPVGEAPASTMAAPSEPEGGCGTSGKAPPSASGSLGVGEAEPPGAPENGRADAGLKLAVESAAEHFEEQAHVWYSAAVDTPEGESVAAQVARASTFDVAAKHLRDYVLPPLGVGVGEGGQAGGAPCGRANDALAGWLAAAEEIEAPYPESVFTPMSLAEMDAAVVAMNAAVPHASERIHAAWARHWAKVLRESEYAARPQGALPEPVENSRVGVGGALPEDAAARLVREALRYSHLSRFTLDGDDVWAADVSAALEALVAVLGVLRLRAEHAEAALARDGFQARVEPWLLECFGKAIAEDRTERGDRLLEEVLELLQSSGYDRGRIGELVAYVYDREPGNPAQEAGGVMVTLAAYCFAHDLDMHNAGEDELERIWRNVEKIRAKQKAKPALSPLPVSGVPVGRGADDPEAEA